MSFNVGQPFIALGQRFALGKLRPLTTGTLTPSVVYQDAELATPFANPLEADDEGIFPPFYSANPSRLRLQIIKEDGDFSTPEVDVDPASQNTENRVSIVTFGGAIGDGIVDDTQAIQDTVDYCALTGYSVYVPGTLAFYKTTDVVDVPARVSFCGDGFNARIRQTTIDKNLFSLGGDNEFWGVHMSGANSDTVTDPFNNGGLYANGVDNISVHHCWMSLFYGSATLFQGCYNIRVQDNMFFGTNWPQNPTYEPSFRACADISFNALGAQTGGRLIATGNYHFGQMSAAIFFNGAGRDIGALITNNHIQPLDASGDPILTGMNNRHGLAINYAADAYSRDTQVVIQGNSIRYVRWAGVYCQSGDGINTGALVIDANVIDHTGIDDASALGGGIRVATGTNAPIHITNNMVTEHQSIVTGGITVQCTLASANAGRVTIRGNSLTRCLGVGLDLVQVITNIDIFDNQIIDSGLNDIRFYQSSAQPESYRVRIMRNRILRNNATTYSIYVFGGAANNYTLIIQDNWMVGSSKTTPTTAVNSAIYLMANSQLFFQIKGNHFEKFYRAITAGNYFVAGRHFNNIVIDGNDFLDLTYGIDFSSNPNTATILVTNSTWNGVTNKFGTALLAGFPCLYEGTRNGSLMNVNSAAAPATGTWIDGDEWRNTAAAVGAPPGGMCTTPGATGVFVFSPYANL